MASSSDSADDEDAALERRAGRYPTVKIALALCNRPAVQAETLSTRARAQLFSEFCQKIAELQRLEASQEPEAQRQLRQELMCLGPFRLGADGAWEVEDEVFRTLLDSFVIGMQAGFMQQLTDISSTHAQRTRDVLRLLELRGALQPGERTPHLERRWIRTVCFAEDLELRCVQLKARQRAVARLRARRRPGAARAFRG